MTRSEPIDVEGTIEYDDFSVPAMPELHFSAKYEWFGGVTPDRSGDSVTPNGPPNVIVTLGEPKEYDITVLAEDLTTFYVSLPTWLQDHLMQEFACEIDDAFLQAIGGQDKLNELAIERAL